MKLESLVQIAICSLVVCWMGTLPAVATDASLPPIRPLPASADLILSDAAVDYLADLDLLVFELSVQGKAGGTVPAARGQIDGAPVLGYVFPTTLAASDIGFGAVEGIVALAITSHPDFDDTPLWDENGDRVYDNDGAVYHTHWVVLREESRVAGGLAVKELDVDDAAVVRPRTHPGMPLYLDSPGFSVVLKDSRLKVLVPAAAVSGRKDFGFDAVTAFLSVATSGDRPRLGVYQVYSVLSGDLSLPYKVRSK